MTLIILANITVLAQYRLYTGVYRIQFNSIGLAPYRLVESDLPVFVGTSRYKNDTVLRYEAVTSIQVNLDMTDHCMTDFCI